MSEARIDPHKFRDPLTTAKGEPRAHVRLEALRTLWFNTGTLCNIECAHCYIDSSPTNDSLAYLSLDDVLPFLDEAPAGCEIGFTGGEPFMNPHMVALLEAAMARGRPTLTLTNAMAPMMRPRVRTGLEGLLKSFAGLMTLRVSLDRPDQERHDAERGPGAFEATIAGVDWLAARGFRVAVAGRLWEEEDEAALRDAFGALFRSRAWPIDAGDPSQLVLFPEMDELADVPEISEACWGILGKGPSDVMCATSRMVVRRKGSNQPVVLACTLIPYDEAFELGHTLAEASTAVSLNHPHCAKFCVLGGGKCAA